MSNSSLVNYKKISPHQYGKRTHKIDTITPHCVVGQCSVETLGSIFQSREASSNYGIGPDGRIGMYVEENCAAWTSSDWANDNRAVTIEVASDAYEPYRMNEKAFAALVKLCVDICKRNGIKKLVWSTNKSDRVNHKNGCNLTVHRDYANKSCPGDWLYNRMGELAKQVNAKLGSSAKLTLIDGGAIYQYAYKDILGGASKVLKNLKKGDKIEFIKDDGWGWCKVKSGSVTGWMMNSHFKSSSLSKFKTFTLSADKTVTVIDTKAKKKAGTKTLKKGTKYTLICSIESGKYKGKDYIKVGSARYYL